MPDPGSFCLPPSRTDTVTRLAALGVTVGARPAPSTQAVEFAPDAASDVSGAPPCPELAPDVEADAHAGMGTPDAADGSAVADTVAAPDALDAAPHVPDARAGTRENMSAFVERLRRGPSGLGTASLHFAATQTLPRTEAPQPGAARTDPQPDTARPESPTAEPPGPQAEQAGEAEPSGRPAPGSPVPGLYHHPVPEPDPARVEEVGRRIKRWAVDEVEAYPPEWEDQFDGFSVGRYMVACHPDAPTVDHLMVATRLMVAENVVDDCYCEDHGGSPVGLGGRLLMAHTALDPVHTAGEYQSVWAQSLHSDAPRRSYRSAMEYFVQAATPSQVDRYQHNMARLHLGYLAEAAWAQTEYLPTVAEYLSMRQFNNFRPCPTITDTVGGYELPAELHALPEMQRVIALAGNASTIANDLYSYTKELDSPGLHLNLPVVIAKRENLSDREGYLKAVEVHNELMHAFEAAAAALGTSCPDPRVLRFLRGVAVWVDGNHYWHQTNTYRYSLPDFW